MTGLPTNVLEYQSPGAVHRTGVVGMVLARVGYGIFGVMVPAGCFLLAVRGTGLSPKWQDGNFASYAALLLDGRAGWVFYPLLAYAMLALIGLIAWPRLVEKYVAVRIGIYGGVVVAFWYAMVMGVAVSHPSGAWGYLTLTLLGMGIWVVAALPLGMVALFGWIKRKWGLGPAWVVLAAGLAGVVVVGIVTVLIAREFQIGWAGMVMIYFTFGGGPIYAMAAYLGASAETWQRSRGQGSWIDTGIMGFFWWLLFGESVAAAIVNMLEVYSRLPTRPPDCYICTAAARGHPRVVGSCGWMQAGGERVRVNRQMRALKAGEIALMTAWPRVHRGCRWIYDRVGPWLARLMVWPVLADAAYLALKPAEWLVRGVLRRGLKDFDRAADRLYR